MSQRTEQFSSLVQQELSRIITEEVEFPKEVLATITRVEISSDLRHSTIYVTVLPDNRRGSTLDLLRASAPALQQRLAGRLESRRIPRLSFAIDEQETYAQEIDRLLDEVSEDLD